MIDGDTFETEEGERVRLIGINAPEISDFFGQEAKRYLSALVENKTVDLQTDNASKDRDQYGRLLRYVIHDGIDINKKMVSDGYAFAYLKYSFGKSDEYREAQVQSRELNFGIWGNSEYSDGAEVEDKPQLKFRQTIPLKTYLIAALVAALVFIGIFTYYRK